MLRLVGLLDMTSRTLNKSCCTVSLSGHSSKRRPVNHGIAKSCKRMRILEKCRSCESLIARGECPTNRTWRLPSYKQCHLCLPKIRGGSLTLDATLQPYDFKSTLLANSRREEAVYQGIRASNAVDFFARFGYNYERSNNIGGCTMGTFFTRCRVENHVDRSKSVTISRVLVDTGSEHTWIPGAKLEKFGVTGRRKTINS